MKIHDISRRTFLRTSVAAAAGCPVVPSCVLGAGGQTPPSRNIAPTTTGAGGRPASVRESARKIPVAAEVDVVVAGGSTAAVAAAVAAAKQGARVFLAAPRHYLGEDMAGTLRLWLEPGETANSPLAESIFRGSEQESPGLPLSYTTDRPSAAGRHQDTSPPSLLCDGRWTSAFMESVQYNGGDVTIRADLGQVQPVKEFRALVFCGSDCAVESISVATSDDGQTWRSAGEAKGSLAAQGSETLTVPLKGSARYVRCTVKKAPEARRVLLGEIIVVPPALPIEKIRTTTPRRVKRALDQALSDAGVQFLYGCCATDLLEDADGRPAGIVLANRSGRQAILAKTVIDATQPAVLARAAGAEFREPASVPLAVRYVVMANETRPTSPTLTVRRLDIPEGARKSRAKKEVSLKDAAWYEYTLKTTLADASWASRAELDQTIRDMVYTPTQLFSADEPFFVPPQSIRGARSAAGQTVEPKQIDLDVFRPAGKSRLWVLGPCADVSRQQAETLMRPVAWIEIGGRVGAAAAAEAQKQPAPQGVHVARRNASPASAGEVKELLDGFRPIPTPRRVPQLAGELPVLGTYDVVVLGGGTAGAPAGVGAARQGAKTLVVEYLDGLGGVGTLGMIGGYWFGNCVGITREIPQRPIEQRMEWYRSNLRRAGADIWFGTLGSGALCEGNRVRGVVVATPYGRGIVLAKTVIDATGSADTAIAAGAEYTYVEEDYAVQNSHLPDRNPGQSYLNGDRPAIDDTDPRNIRMVIQDKLRTGVQDFDIGQLMDTRERRRIVGDYCLDWLDVINQRTFPDSVVHSRSDYDSHGYQIHPFFSLTSAVKKHMYWAYVPYRCLLPRGLEGILVAGIAMSAHRDAMPITRMQPDQHNLGYAAGVAAAMASRQGVTPRQVDVKALQQHLVKVGNVPSSVLTDRDSYPLSAEKVRAAVKAVTGGYRDVEVLLGAPRESLPLLKDAYAKATSRDEVIYAHVLAAMGDSTGMPTLLEAIQADRFPTMKKQTNGAGGRYGAIRAIGFTRDRRAVPLLAELAAAPGTADDFQLVRSLASALGRIGDPAAAPALADLLKKSQSSSNKVQILIVACALYRCGDVDGQAQRLLRQYVEQDEKPLSRLAWQVLSTPSK